MNYFWITIFGILGVLARYQTGLGFEGVNSNFPISTLTVNLIGSFLIGFMYILLENSRALPPHISLAIIVGFLGGYTTFSSLTLDVFKMINASQIRTAIIYVSVSLIGGILLVWAGASLAKVLFGKTTV
jgi:CrcB protein